VNRLIDELATVALTEYDSETRFRTMRRAVQKNPPASPFECRTGARPKGAQGECSIIMI
jgi:hypothetical protein